VRETAAHGGRCVPNIGPGGRRRRLWLGAMAWGVTAVGLAFLLAVDAPRTWRLVLALPAWAGAIGFFQYREKT
jgi:hypothetical protein